MHMTTARFAWSRVSESVSHFRQRAVSAQHAHTFSLLRYTRLFGFFEFFRMHTLDVAVQRRRWRQSRCNGSAAEMKTNR